MPPCLIKLFEKTLEKLNFNFSWPYIMYYFMNHVFTDLSLKSVAIKLRTINILITPNIHNFLKYILQQIILEIILLGIHCLAYLLDNFCLVFAWQLSRIYLCLEFLYMVLSWKYTFPDLDLKLFAWLCHPLK